MKITAIFSLVILLLLGLSIGCDRGISQSKYDELELSYSSLINSNASLKEEYNELLESNLSLEKEYDELKVNYDLLNNSNDQSNSELDQVRQELDDLYDELEFVKAQLDLYEKTGISVFSNVKPRYTKDGANTFESGYFGRPTIELNNNREAVDPSWSQLKDFILKDGTNKKKYIEGNFTCGNFAEQVHTRAEDAGIKAAIVAINFVEEGSVAHALNAFYTIDQGLVYIDCTGQESQSSPDRIAFVVVGKECGFLDLTNDTPLTYEGYEEIADLWDSFKQKLDAYNLENEGKTII